MHRSARVGGEEAPCPSWEGIWKTRRQAGAARGGEGFRRLRRAAGGGPEREARRSRCQGVGTARGGGLRRLHAAACWPGREAHGYEPAQRACRFPARGTPGGGQGNGGANQACQAIQREPGSRQIARGRAATAARSRTRAHGGPKRHFSKQVLAEAAATAPPELAPTHQAARATRRRGNGSQLAERGGRRAAGKAPSPAKASSQRPAVPGGRWQSAVRRVGRDGHRPCSIGLLRVGLVARLVFV